MPTIAIIGKLKIQMYADDHHPPHFHATAGDHEALIRLSDLSVLQGRITRRNYDALVEWALVQTNRDKLEHAWKRLNAR